MNKLLAKFKADNEPTCLLCKHYLKCHRIRAGDCFKLSRDIWIDFYNTFSDYFDSLKQAARMEDKNES